MSILDHSELILSLQEFLSVAGKMFLEEINICVIFQVRMKFLAGIFSPIRQRPIGIGIKWRSL